MKINQPASAASWPPPRYLFKVHFATSGLEGNFQLISGLDYELPSDKMNDDKKPAFSFRPDTIRENSIILENGYLIGLADLLDTDRNPKIVRRELITIQLVDDSGNAVIRWRLEEAWPCRISGVDLNNETSHTTLKTLEISYKSIEMLTEG